MIVLCYLVIALLSFTRISIWLQVALALVPSVLMSAQMHNLVPIRVAVFALAGALVPYVPLVALASFVIAGGFRTAFRRLRFIYFLFVLLLSVVLAFNLTQTLWLAE
jgi:hypothetical protein